MKGGKTFRKNVFLVLRKFSLYGPGEMAQWLRVVALLAEDPGPISSIHTVAHNHPSLQFQGIQYWRALRSCGARPCIHTNHANIKL